MNKPTIAITVGDLAGVGPEVVKKAVSNKFVLKICEPIVINAAKVNQKSFVSGKPSAKNNKFAVASLNKAIKLLENGSANAIVTGPVPKSAFGRSGGHTEFFAKKTNSKNVEMLMVAKDKKVLLLTRHIPLKDVSKSISTKKIVKSTLFVCDFLKEKYNIKKPRVVVCGLNPHCGDSGLVGVEEKQKIIPAVAILKKGGLDVAGPVNPEVAFKKKSDLLVCMYHDQAMVPLKLLYQNSIVNVTVGLPFIRTSPGHGTAYNIAGKNKASSQAMVEAIKVASMLARKVTEF